MTFYDIKTVSRIEPDSTSNYVLKSIWLFQSVFLRQNITRNLV